MFSNLLRLGRPFFIVCFWSPTDPKFEKKTGWKKKGRYRYIGETARNAYSRGREHLSMLKNRNKASVLWEDCRDVHSGNMVDFKMSVIKRYKNDAVLRQIMESVIIESSDQG